MLDGKSSFLGLVGKELSYSLSPQIHNLALQQLGIPAVYLPFSLLDAGKLDQVLDSLFQLGCLGLNVTQPYKEQVGQLLGKPGAWNTLSRGSEFWQASSTDGGGFMRSLELMGQPISTFERILFLGNGGATLSLITTILSECKESMTSLPWIGICGRTVDSLQRWQKTLPPSAGLHEFSWQDLHAISSALIESEQPTLVIHATNALTDPLAGFYPILAKLSIPRTLFYDLNYSAGRQFLVDWAVKENRRACNGLAMLIEQARLSQEIWFGRSLGFQDILVSLTR